MKFCNRLFKLSSTCQFKDEEIEEKLPMLLDELVNYDKYYSATPV